MTTHWKQKACFTLSTALIFILILAIVLVRISVSHREESARVEFPKKTINADNEYNNQNFSNGDWTPTVDINNSYPTLSRFYENVPHEYVQPLKIHNFSLNEADLLYESKRNNTDGDYSAPYSVTGNYRGKSNKIWDPHPEYTINAFGHHLHLVLHQDTSFVSTNIFRVIKILNNQTEEQDDTDHYLGCYYKGFVQGDEESAVAVSLCHGMTGHIKTSFASLLIQPVENSTTDDSNLLHKIWQQSSRQSGHGRESVDIDFNLVQGNTTIMPRLSRRKRDLNEEHLYTMEVLVAVDRTMAEFHENDLKSYILTLISIVSNIFADASIGNSIKISVTNVVIIKNGITEPFKTNASSLLKNFCSLVRKRKYNYDTAIMLTRDQICRNEKQATCDTLGLAELGTVCKPYSCSIVQDNGLPAAFTIAHELGHVLNMPHDDDKRCAKFKHGGRNTLNIMSSTMGDNIHPWSWSACSRHYVSEFLEKEDTSCLEDTPIVPDNLKRQLPGQMYSLDHQCQLIHGQYSQYCDIDSECKRLWCKAPATQSNCRSSNLPWADGTPCENSNSWCVKGECVSKEGMKPVVVHGGWGPWSTFTRCSMTCGGGVQESQRECDNPLPQNGGKYCSGNRKKYRSCNTQNCPNGTLEFREQQCQNLNGNHFGIKGLTGQVRWVPKYGLKDNCKLYCRVENSSLYFGLEDKVEDGTPCSLDNFDKCVNGICRPAGCNNELNSNAQLDKCGVCEGSNDTCEEVEGHFYKSDLLANATKSKSDYFYVTTIPRGSSNIEIVQPEYNNITYIALRDDNGKYLLNGERVLKTFQYVLFYAGVALEYNGYNSTVQRVNSTKSRKTHRDLIVELISGGFENDNERKLLSYSYTIATSRPKPVPVLYQWVSSWTPCNSLCQGTSTRTLSCVEIESSLKVATPFCDGLPKSEEALSSKCNTHCTLRLNYTSISECSSECGMIGMREKKLICIQDYFGSESREINLSYCSTQHNISRFEQCREGCWNYTEWSPCSESCGTGTQRRNVVCYEDQRIVDDSRCNIRKKSEFKDVYRSCNVESCIETFKNFDQDLIYNHYSSWETGKWGECGDNCEKTRQVKCRNEYDCPLEKKPMEKRKCCNIKIVATWSACSVECGNGNRTREFFCARVYKPEHKGQKRRRVQIDSKYCNEHKFPIPKRPQKSCKTSCKWAAEQWPTCSPNCSSSFITRSVNCSASNGRQISHKYCDINKKPIARKMCPYCIHRETKFSNCSCEGYRRRRVECFDVNRKRIACPTRQRLSKERCNDIPDRCFHSCLDVKRYSSSARDGFYNLSIKQRIIRIYCHNMSTKPEEYIAVNSTQNYSVFYDKSASNRYMCPPESRYSEYPTIAQNYGQTHFNKIRFNIHTMEVTTNDFTFADTVGKPQPYGSAGDCYNKNQNCPQGSFSINLDGTGFKMQSHTKWETFGQLSSIKYVNYLQHPYTSIRAFCGGYCGGCNISKSTSLLLDFYNG